MARARELFATWATLLEAPFKGITTDGTVRSGLFALQPEGAPAAAMAQAAAALLDALTPAQRASACFPVDSHLWRCWQNTELWVERHGLRLDAEPPALRDRVMAVLAASLSAKGYEISRSVMHLNRFLGDLVGAPHVLGEWSYTFCLFGEPSDTEPWGWQLFGHHLALNCLVIGPQMVLTPCFLGAEPAWADTGPFAGTRLFEDEERKGLDLVRSLSRAQQRRAVLAPSIVSPDLPPGRRHFADNLQLGGACQDNRIVPLEGLPGTELSAAQRQALLDLVADYLAPLPAGPHAARMAQVERHLAATHFCWIGGLADTSTFYYRIQSPVIFIEFDHHAGVFLTNEEPARFHVHTIVRTPNGNDYGFDLLRRHYAEAHRSGGDRAHP